MVKSINQDMEPATPQIAINQHEVLCCYMLIELWTSSQRKEDINAPSLLKKNSNEGKKGGVRREISMDELGL